jgi:hypothetical protein
VAGGVARRSIGSGVRTSWQSEVCNATNSSEKRLAPEITYSGPSSRYFAADCMYLGAFWCRLGTDIFDEGAAPEDCNIMDVTQLPIPHGPATKVVVLLSTGKMLVT